MKSKKNILLGLTLTSAMLIGGNNLPAQTGETLKDSKKNLVENFGSIPHESIITMKISDLVGKYGLETAQELVRKHCIIEINKYKKGEKYQSNEILTKYAQSHADYISKNDYFDHENLDGKHVWDRVDSLQYNYKYLGENISNDNNLSEVIMSYLHSSKGGHEEILESKYDDIGIGISPVLNIDTETSKYYFVFDFGKKL